MTNKKHDIVPVHLVVQAMRDNGYKSAAHAIAELIDNAIQAGATQIELLCGEKEVQHKQRKGKNIDQIAVLDNGSGMNEEILRLALQFGNGTHLAEHQRDGIGRFGMGLPSSSISQCQKVEVWTWQDGIENAIYSYLDVNEIKNKIMTEVPEPEQRKIPILWTKVGKSFAKTGTLVVWSQLDRCIWKTGKTIISNSEYIIGRMYRKFLDNGQIKIRMVTFDVNYPSIDPEEKEAMPNDPGYLMSKTSCPAPFDTKPMFKHYEGEENHEIEIKVDFEEKIHSVKLRFSHAKSEARQGNTPGALPHGKHADKNTGVSIVRAGRELELDKTVVISSDPTERWWGVEVEFPPSLDELFGVTNNKQSACNFTELLKFDIDSLLEDQTIHELQAQLIEEQDPKGPLLEVAQKIVKTLRSIRKVLKEQTRDSRSLNTKRYDDAEMRATIKTETRKKEGYTGLSDQEESLPQETRQEIIENTLKADGVSENQAKTLAARTIGNNLKYTFAEAGMDTPAFFSVKSKAGAIIVTLNTDHPAYEKLVEVLEEDTEGESVQELKQRLGNSLEGLKLLLMAWARYEDEQPNETKQQIAKDIRADWGRVARKFLEDDK